MKQHRKRPTDKSATRPTQVGGPEPVPPDSGATHPPISKHWPWLFGLLLIAAMLLAYQPLWHAGFIWDDDFYVTGNPMLRDAAGLRQIWFKVDSEPQYYPLVFTTLWLEFHLWGLQPLGYHLDNVLLHTLAALLLGCVLRRLRVPGAWLAAAIFALHPVQVESVAWVTERKNVLSALFYFGAVLAYLRYVERATSDKFQVIRTGSILSRATYRVSLPYGLALGLFLGALFSKTVTCSLPMALLLVCWWKNNRVRFGDVLPLLPFFALGATLGLQTVWVEKYHVGAHGAEWSLTLADRCLIAGRALWFYAAKLAWPAQLTFIYPRWGINPGIGWQWIFPAAAAGVVGVLWLLRNRFGRGPLAGVLFFAGTLGPALGFMDIYPMRYSFVADHFQYLASAGIIALVAALVARVGEWQKRPAVAYGFAVIVLPMLAVLTWRQAGTYRDMETLWRTTIDRNPNCWMAYENLGGTLLAQGKLDEASQNFERALQLKPDDEDALNDLGVVLYKQLKLDEAIRYYERALQLKPDYADAHCNFGLALVCQGKLDEAIQHFERALQLKPYDPETHGNLGIALAKQGKLTEAIQNFQQALTLATDQGNTALAEDIRTQLKLYQTALPRPQTP
jgi:Tfp pilus assembly protein PilF